MSRKKLPLAWYCSASTLELSQQLLGKYLVRDSKEGRTAGMIVETEAYVGTTDRACHAFDGRRSARNETMYAAPGTSYVYICYGIHHLFNVVVQKEGDPHAVLIRALEPEEGMHLMLQRRGLDKPAFRLTKGPGSLSVAMDIDKELNGVMLHQNRLWIEDRGVLLPDSAIAAGPRVGVKGAGPEAAAKPWRFWLEGNPWVSRWVP